MTIDGTIIKAGEIVNVPTKLDPNGEYHDLDNPDHDCENDICDVLEAKYFGDAPTHMCRLILSEHFGGGEGLAGGSKLHRVHCQIDNKEVTVKEFTDKYLMEAR